MQCFVIYEILATTPQRHSQFFVDWQVPWAWPTSQAPPPHPPAGISISTSLHHAHYISWDNFATLRHILNMPYPRKISICCLLFTFNLFQLRGLPTIFNAFRLIFILITFSLFQLKYLLITFNLFQLRGLLITFNLFQLRGLQITSIYFSWEVSKSHLIYFSWEVSKSHLIYFSWEVSWTQASSSL